MKTLIAEDDPSCRALLQTFLSTYGECDVATNGEEAVETARAALQAHHKYDLICMDLLMPVMDGQEAIREIRKDEAKAGIFARTVKIITTTSVSSVEVIQEAYRNRCDAYLLKPIDTARLLEELKTLGLVR